MDNQKLIFATLLTAILTVAVAPSMIGNIYATSNNDNGDDNDNGDKNSILKAKPEGKELKTKEKEPKDKKPNQNKDKEKVKNCQVKAQLKVYGAEANSTVTAQLETLIPQSKQAVNATEPVTFNFQYKKGDLTCPLLEELPKTVYGTVNEEYFSGIIKSLTKLNKLTYELQGVLPEQPQ